MTRITRIRPDEKPSIDTGFIRVFRVFRGHWELVNAEIITASELPLLGFSNLQRSATSNPNPALKPISRTYL